MGWTFVAAGVGVVICFLGVHRNGIREGFSIGIEQGTLRALKDFLDGKVRIEGDELMLDNASFALYDNDGKRLMRLRVEDLEITED